MKTFNDDDLEILEKNINERAEEMSFGPGIYLDELEIILTRFFKRKITLNT